MRINKLVLALGLIGLTLVSTSLHAQVESRIAEVSAVRMSGGMSKEFTNQSFENASVPRSLVKAERLTREQQRVADQAAQVFQNSSALTMMIVDRGQIIYENYRSPATPITAQFSFSMSKSLVAYVIGGLLCDGKIASLDDPAKKYAPELEGTVFGNAPIRHLLTMSSGAVDSKHAGNAYKTANSDQWMDQRSGATTTLDVIRRYGQTDIASGREFRYLANDTQSLGLIINNLGGFHANFQRYVWGPTQASAPGYWLMGRDNLPITASGFSAVTSDWARMAMFTVDARKNGSACMREFMSTATTQQIANSNKRLGNAFNGYGYQTWANPQFGDRRSYWWVGYGGQRVGIDAERQRIIVVTSSREDYMADVYRLFAELQRY